ncbi:hypothetical protein C8J57DRAFT_1535717 [Mycena rebaudengoi]|nr:hypothetical protein C8J57DRAFT_1535717 [Mycena rebaudengoi]
MRATRKVPSMRALFSACTWKVAKCWPLPIPHAPTAISATSPPLPECAAPPPTHPYSPAATNPAARLFLFPATHSARHEYAAFARPIPATSASHRQRPSAHTCGPATPAATAAACPPILSSHPTLPHPIDSSSPPSPSRSHCMAAPHSSQWRLRASIFPRLGITSPNTLAFRNGKRSALHLRAQRNFPEPSSGTFADVPTSRITGSADRPAHRPAHHPSPYAPSRHPDVPPAHSTARPASCVTGPPRTSPRPLTARQLPHAAAPFHTPPRSPATPGASGCLASRRHACSSACSPPSTPKAHYILYYLILVLIDKLYSKLCASPPFLWIKHPL